MKHFQLVHIGRHPTEHYAMYKIISDGNIIVDSCSTAESYQHLVNLMAEEDTYQEIDGDESNVFTYKEALRNHYLLNSE